jgi:hypothetical protein
MIECDDVKALRAHIDVARRLFDSRIAPSSYKELDEIELLWWETGKALFAGVIKEKAGND